MKETSEPILDDKRKVFLTDAACNRLLRSDEGNVLNVAVLGMEFTASADENYGGCDKESRNETTCPKKDGVEPKV